MCGEKQAVDEKHKIQLGSPPHVRGKERMYLWGCEYDRITPACAGKSIGQNIKIRAARDHPRMCGEKTIAIFIIETPLGSPPHVRGKD